MPAGAVHGSGSNGVGAGGGNSQLAVAATMTVCGSWNVKRIVTAVGDCGGGNSLHYFAWWHHKSIVI